MTGEPRSVRVEPEHQSVASAVPESPERALDETPSWPVTRLAAWSFTLLLWVSIVGPATASRPRAIEWLALLVPSIVASLIARTLFEVLGFATRFRGPVGQLAGALPPALVAAGLMAGACTIVGVRWSPVIGGTTTVMTMLTLALAGAAREVEIRLRRGLRRVYFVGSMDARNDLERELGRRFDARLVGARTVVAGSANGLVGTGVAEDVLSSGATVLVLDGYAMRAPELVEVAARLNLAGVRVRDLVSYYEDEFKKVPLGELSPTWFLFDIASIHRRVVYRRLRRAFEFGFAATLLVISSPLLLLAAILIRLTSPGPALYRQHRVGKGGLPFTLVKLRTMAESTEADVQAAWAPSQVHRVTRIGALLRRYRLDELPQIWNILRGDLALVGPRPEQVPIVERLDQELPHYNARHCIRPGLTGWAQVNLGYGGSVDGTIAKLQRDLYYVKHQSLRLDALIIWLTLRAVLAGRG
jgi:lipopolysaccharide/colanic/teichoic acid biosynthesis glycosyltransferase